MTLADFLISVLEAHAQTLQRLAALVGEDILLELLEAVGENAVELPELRPLNDVWEPSAHAGYEPEGSPSPYAKLEHRVREFGLPAILEFHLWAYPFYRAYIESSLPLSARISHGPRSDAGNRMVDQAVDFAQAWIRRFPVSPDFAPQLERAAQVPWLRFRTEVLKKIGRRPLGPVY